MMNQEEKKSALDQLQTAERNGHMLQIDLLFKGLDSDAQNVKSKCKLLSDEYDNLIADILQEWTDITVLGVVEELKKTNKNLQGAIHDINNDIDTAENAEKTIGYLDEAIKLSRQISRKKSNWKYTLSEFIIVIGVIGILAGIGVPQFLAFRDRSFKKISEPIYLTAVVDNIKKKLECGWAALIAPNRMDIEDKYRVKLYISLNSDILDTVYKLKSAQQDWSLVDIGNRMEANLASLSFNIGNESPALQAVQSQTLTSWSWTIEPLKEGVHDITSTLSVIVDVDDKETPLVSKYFKKSIIVEESKSSAIWTFLQKHMPWLWAPLVAILSCFVCIIKWIKRNAVTSQ